MAFSPEVRFRIGADTSALEKGFVAAKSAAAAAGAVMSKSFSMKDTFRGFAQGLGMNGPEAIAEMVIKRFRAAAEHAKDLKDDAAAMAGITMRTIGAIGGPTRDLEMKRRTIKDMNREIEIQQRLVNDLEGDWSRYVNDNSQALYTEAERELRSMKQKQAELSAEVQITVDTENKHTAALSRQMVLEHDIANVQLKGGTELEQLQKRLLAAQAEYNILQKQGALPSTLQANNAQQTALSDRIKAVAKASKEKQEDLRAATILDTELTKVELRNGTKVEKLIVRLKFLREEYNRIRERRGITSAEAQQNRNEQNTLNNQLALAGAGAQRQFSLFGKSLAESPPKGRGRSEAERIAARGLNYERRAEEAARTGKSSAFVAQLSSYAERDFAKAGDKLARQWQSADGVAITATKMIEAVQELKDLNAKLSPQNIK